MSSQASDDDLKIGRLALVVETPDEQKRRYAEGKACWSAGFGVILEKHGFISFDELYPEVLDDPDVLGRYEALIVTRLRESTWTDSRIENIYGSGRQWFLEGPLPRPVLEPLGILGYKPIWNDGVIRVLDAHIRRLGAAYGFSPGGRLTGEVRTIFSRRPDGFEWALAEECSIDKRQATIWGETPFEFAPWRTREGKIAPEIVAVLDADKAGRGTQPAIVRQGSVTASCFDVLSLLVWHHTSEPLGVNTHRVPPSVPGLETMVFGMIDDMFRRAGARRARLKPWPRGIDWALNVRHDFDREITAARAAEVLAVHERHGTKATWYWRGMHAKSAALPLVCSADGHEIGFHTERLWFGGADDLKGVQELVDKPIVGATAHGGHTSFRFQGAPNIEWLLQQQMEYSELPTRNNFLPHFFVNLSQDGCIEKGEMLCLPLHVTIDTTLRVDGTCDVEGVLARIRPIRAAHGFVQIMNHPDINLDALDQILEACHGELNLKWTAADVTKWWRQSHDRAHASLSSLPDDSRLVFFPGNIADLVSVEILYPDGHLTEVTPDAAPSKEGASATTKTPSDVLRSRNQRVDPGSAPKSSQVVEWSDVVEAMRASIRNYYVETNQDPDSSASKSTTRSNTDLVPARVSQLIKFSKHVLKNDDDIFRDKFVFEVGCGLGSFALYLSTGAGARHVLAMDVRDDLCKRAALVANAAGLAKRIEFVKGDMTNLNHLGEAAFDTIVCNNSLYYVPHRPGVRLALTNFFRLLRPGGHLIIYQANRWRSRDGLTKDPIVHLMPGWLAKIVCSYTGWRHSHGRVEFISPIDLRIRLRRAGFTQIRQTGNLRGKPLDGLRGMFADFFFTIATKR